jgi:succinate-semialdehyde dehydrogenase/glutarate-semialdehyde dehydrogenase
MLKRLLEAKKVGDPENKDTEIGPLVSEKQLKTLELQVEDAISKGAKVVIGGKRPQNLKGNYYLPTLLVNIKPNMKVWTEEVFGPVLPIIPFSSESEAIALANDTKYGLGGYIFTRDNKKALRVAEKLKTNGIAVNNATYVLPCNPFGGYKQSGIGREHGKYGLRELCQVKVISLEK